MTESYSKTQLKNQSMVKRLSLDYKSITVPVISANNPFCYQKK